MYVLDFNQVNKITSLVEREELHYSHLKEDLIDHICCDVENLMYDEEIDFHEALKRVVKEIGYGGLKKIQESTLFLINKNYRKMKKTMRIFGLVAPTLIALGGLFKIMHWPGASVLLILGSVLLSFVFLPSAIYVIHKETKGKKRMLVSISGFIGGFAYILGILFKIMHWPGAGTLLLLGLGILSLVFLPSLLIGKSIEVTNKKLKNVYILIFLSVLFWASGTLFKIMHWPGANILVMAGMLSVVVVALPAYYFVALKRNDFVKGTFIFIVIAITEVLLTSGLMQLNIGVSFMESFVDTEINLEKTISYLEEKNEQIYAIDEEPELSKQIQLIQQKTSEMNEYIKEVKMQLVNSIEGDNAKNVINGQEIEPMFIMNKDVIGLTNEILLGEDNDGLAYEINSRLIAYHDFLLNYTSEEGIPLKSDIKQTDWVELTFREHTLIAALNGLGLIQEKVLISGSRAANSLLYNSTLKN